MPDTIKQIENKFLDFSKRTRDEHPGKALTADERETYAKHLDERKHFKGEDQMNNSMSKMTKGERVELGLLIRKRERVMKSIAVERSAAMLADFEKQCAAIYSFDQDEVWKDAFERAKKITDEAESVIAERCKELGIPKEFAPSVSLHWYGRGENAVAARRAELRKVAKAQIARIEKEAITKIERMSLEAQTEVIAHGLESEAALGFLERMPDIAVLMPALDAAEIQQQQEERPQKGRRELST